MPLDYGPWFNNKNVAKILLRHGIKKQAAKMRWRSDAANAGGIFQPRGARGGGRATIIWWIKQMAPFEAGTLRKLPSWFLGRKYLEGL